jgi:EAL domain-containing protein (putative c-di-GMP-specific phosphodiesterase class I)
VDANLFDLEIKESVAANPDLVNATVLRLVNEGIRVSIDEFGTGYSSLNELAKLKIHRLKISRELIANITENDREKAILKAVVKLAKVIGFEVYIKGVETQMQYEILKKMDVDGMQGYYFTTPLSAEEFENAYLEIK